MRCLATAVSAIVMMMVVASLSTAQPPPPSPPNCIIWNSAEAKLEHGAQKSVLYYSFYWKVACDSGGPNQTGATCNYHMYRDLYSTTDGGQNWYSVWNQQYTCFSSNPNSCAPTPPPLPANPYTVEYTSWEPGPPTAGQPQNMLAYYNTAPGVYQTATWLYRGNCRAGDTDLLRYAVSDEVSLP